MANIKITKKTTSEEVIQLDPLNLSNISGTTLANFNKLSESELMQVLKAIREEYMKKKAELSLISEDIILRRFKEKCEFQTYGQPAFDPAKFKRDMLEYYRSVIVNGNSDNTIVGIRTRMLNNLIEVCSLPEDKTAYPYAGCGSSYILVMRGIAGSNFNANNRSIEKFCLPAKEFPEFDFVQNVADSSNVPIASATYNNAVASSAGNKYAKAFCITFDINFVRNSVRAFSGKVKSAINVASIDQEGADYSHPGYSNYYLKNNSSYLNAAVNSFIVAYIRVANSLIGKIWPN